MFFEVEGTGHILGRQFSVITDEPFFRSFNTVMEGNNEIDIDGRQRQLDYLGTEDSFTFSWGFQETFAAERVGMTLVELGDVNRLSIYRFHDHMPIRFNKSLKWHINWQNEKFFTGNPAWHEAVARGGCWVDYATVHYWYQTVPGGFEHQPLRPLADRMKMMLHPVSDPPGLRAALGADPGRSSAGKQVRHARKISNESSFAMPTPTPMPSGSISPNRGVAIRVTRIRESRASWPLMPRVSTNRARSCGKSLCRPSRIPPCGWSSPAIRTKRPAKSDFLLQAGIFEGGQIKWFDPQVIDAGTPPTVDNWQTLEYPLTEYTGKTVGIIIKVSYGGKIAALNEEAFFDEISVVAK